MFRLTLILLLFANVSFSQDFVANVSVDDHYDVVKSKLNHYINNSNGLYGGITMRKEGNKCLGLIPDYPITGSNQNDNLHSKYFFVFKQNALQFYEEELGIHQLNRTIATLNGYHVAIEFTKAGDKKYQWSIPCCYVELTASPGKARFEVVYEVK